MGVHLGPGAEDRPGRTPRGRDGADALAGQRESTEALGMDEDYEAEVAGAARKLAHSEAPGAKHEHPRRPRRRDRRRQGRRRGRARERSSPKPPPGTRSTPHALAGPSRTPQTGGRARERYWEGRRRGGERGGGHRANGPDARLRLPRLLGRGHKARAALERPAHAGPVRRDHTDRRRRTPDLHRGQPRPHRLSGAEDPLAER